MSLNKMRNFVYKIFWVTPETFELLEKNDFGYRIVHDEGPQYGGFLRYEVEIKVRVDRQEKLYQLLGKGHKRTIWEQ